MAKIQKKIVVVDDDNTSLSAYKNILKQSYEVFPVPSAAKMFDLLRHVMPDLILLDVDMPEINGYEAAGRLKKDELLCKIPVIFLSGRVDPQSEAFGLNMGAVDYIHKPIVKELLLKRIDNQLSLVEARKSLEERKKSVRETRDSLKAIIGVLGSAGNSSDPGVQKSGLHEAGNMAKKLLSLLDSAAENDN